MTPSDRSQIPQPRLTAKSAVKTEIEIGIGTVSETHHRPLHRRTRCEAQGRASSEAPRTEQLALLESLRGTHINVEGTIAAGKSTFCRDVKALCDALGVPCRVLQEDIVMDYLNAFIGDQRRHALGFQLDVFQNRVNCFMAAKLLARGGEIVLTDRGLAGDWIFAKHNREMGNMSEGEYSIYMERREQWVEKLRGILPRRGPST